MPGAYSRSSYLATNNWQALRVLRKTLHLRLFQILWLSFSDRFGKPYLHLSGSLSLALRSSPSPTMTSKISTTIKLRGRTVDTGLHSPRSKSASVPATAEYIITSDKKKFLNSPFGRANANRHERSLEKLSSPSSVDSAHPVEPANPFGSVGSPSAGSTAES